MAYTFINTNPTPTWNQGNQNATSIRPNLRLTLNSVTKNTGNHPLYGELYLFATMLIDTAASYNTPCSWTVQIWYSANGTTWGGAAKSVTRNLIHGSYHGWNNSELHGIQGIEHTFPWGSEPIVYVRIWCQSSVHVWDPMNWQQTAYAQRQMPTVVWIHDGSDWVAHIPYIHDGSNWRHSVAHSHDGSKWCMVHA